MQLRTIAMSSRFHRDRVQTARQRPPTSVLARCVRCCIAVTILAGCGSDKHPAIDAAVEIDAAPLPLDCPTYCTEIQSNCSGANAQYPDMAHCAATCASFAIGTSTTTDTSGNTLGCRINYAGALSKMAAATHCVHAGPAGDLLMASPPAFCSGGDICTTFCNLEIKACGSLDAPLAGNPRDADGNPLFQYRNFDDCMRLCPAFDRTHPYSIVSAGDSLACRLRHATSAAIAVTPNGAMYCSATAAAPTGPCDGLATP
jgi:hypothetical protein